MSDIELKKTALAIAKGLALAVAFFLIAPIVAPLLLLYEIGKKQDFNIY